MEVVILNPSGVYGPGPSPTRSLENGLFEPVVEKTACVAPGGTGYAFTGGGVAEGHARRKSDRGGERYILTDGYASFREIAETVRDVAGRGRVPPVMPVPVARAAAAVGEAISRVIRSPPMLPRDSSYFLRWQATPIPPRRRASSAGRPPRPRRRPQDARRNGPAGPANESARCRQEAAYAAGPGEVGLAVRPPQVGLLDQAHLELETGSRSRRRSASQVGTIRANPTQAIIMNVDRVAAEAEPAAGDQLGALLGVDADPPGRPCRSGRRRCRRCRPRTRTMPDRVRASMSSSSQIGSDVGQRERRAIAAEPRPQRRGPRRTARSAGALAEAR